jgi:two-component system sensor histidine kinase DegS
MAIGEALSGNGDNSREDLKEDLQAELERAKRELREIELMLDQSQLEVSRLAQKNAALTAKLQQMHGHFDTIPRQEIREVYDDAMDAQQRLFIMRGQLEKLQSDQQHWEKLNHYLARVLDSIGLDTNQAQTKGSDKVLTNLEAIIQAQESERQRLSRQMHDGPAQALSNFILQTEIAVRLFDIDQERAREELAVLKSSASAAFKQVRDFVFELRPMMLDDLGLVPTLKRYIEAFREQTDTTIRFTVNGVERRLESYIEVILFRAIQEILTFGVRQCQASQISVQLNIAEAFIKATVDDNGNAIDKEVVLEGAGMGIKGIKDRVEMMGGYLEIDSRPERGNQIVFQVPIGVSSQAVFE